MKIDGLHTNNLFAPTALQGTMDNKALNMAVQDNSAVINEASNNAALNPLSSSESMLFTNFSSSGSLEQSKYLEARKKGQAALSRHANAQNAILNTAMTQLTDGSYTSLTLAGKKAVRMMMADKQRIAFEESERNLKESKDTIEERVEAATKNNAETANTSVSTIQSPILDLELQSDPPVRGVAPPSAGQASASSVHEVAVNIIV